jgi:hypothetical protein
MEKSSEIDLFKVFIWVLKSFIKRWLIILIVLVVTLGYGIYKNSNKNYKKELIQHTSILKSNLPNMGAMYKLSSALLSDNIENLKTILLINDSDIKFINSVIIDTTYKPMIILKIEGSNQESILYVKHAFLTFYNIAVKEDILFEIEKSKTLIRKFNSKSSGKILTDSVFQNADVSFKDKEQLEAFEKGMDYVKRKQNLETNGAFTEIKSYETKIVNTSGTGTFKTLLIFSLIGLLSGCLLALFMEGFRALLPFLKSDN